ncbi:hypothetical protein ACIQU6_44330 [Streptomyces sp. NPDC090442]|uniref:hypothetical protein n=1 Tax=Streptomyces sp. NPDC090442 TaxID=3365962 RepID=UPI0037F367DC
MAKLRIKVSGCLRTLQGAQDFAAIRTYLATADRHDQPMLDVLLGQPCAYGAAVLRVGHLPSHGP